MLAAQIPLIPDVGILALPYHHFGSRWLTPHHVMTRLASYFHVLWLEPAHHWREIQSLTARRQAIPKLVYSIPSSFHVHISEPWLPDMHRPSWMRRMLSAARIRRGWGVLKHQGCRKLVLHLWHYQFESALAVGRQNLSLYHIDDEYSFSPEPPPMDPGELRVLRAVDQVFAISPGLMEKRGGQSSYDMYTRRRRLSTLLDTRSRAGGHRDDPSPAHRIHRHSQTSVGLAPPERPRAPPSPVVICFCGATRSKRGIRGHRGRDVTFGQCSPARTKDDSGSGRLSTALRRLYYALPSQRIYE